MVIAVFAVLYLRFCFCWCIPFVTDCDCYSGDCGVCGVALEGFVSVDGLAF